MRKMDDSEKASLARSKLALLVMASNEGNPVAKRQVLQRLSAADPRVRRVVRDVQIAYFLKEERIQI